MKLRDQICSLELAKLLKGLGVEQESLFYHYQEKTPKSTNDHCYGYKQEDMPWKIDSTRPDRLSTLRPRVHEWCSAFTSAELGDMLPANTDHYRLMMWKLDSTSPGGDRTLYGCSYGYPDRLHALPEFPVWETFVNPNEAESRGMLLCYLINTFGLKVMRRDK